MTIQSELLAARIDIVLVELWDFVSVNGSGPFTADVLQTDQSSSISPTALLLEVHSPSSTTPRNIDTSSLRRDMQGQPSIS
jgi:hypothetical protein